jgi:hypothetical protein
MDRRCVNRRADADFVFSMDNISQHDYVRHVLAAYCRTPTTAGRVNRQDRLLAVRFYQRCIPIDVIENAFVLGAVRRLYRNPDNLPLPPVRSLYYFCGLIEEVFDLKSHPKTSSAYLRYFEYLRHKIRIFDQFKQRFPESQKT